MDGHSRSVAALRAHKHPDFAPGNEMHKSHGARAEPWRLAGRSMQIADLIREEIKDVQPSDEFLIRLAALAMTRIELASRWLEENPERIISKSGKTVSLLADMRSWESQAAKHLKELGLTPQARRQSAQATPGDVLSAYLAQRDDS